ncbi:MAG: replication protein C, IncQ-type [Trichloromonadaceae bacterium]
MATVAKFAKLDPSLAIASLFRPITRGRRPRAFEMTTENDGLILRWRSFEHLDSRDQSVLYACAALVMLEPGGHLNGQSSGKMGQQLWLDLVPEERAVKDNAIAFDTSYYKILEAAGMESSGKDHYDRLKDILNRLSDVSIRAQKDGYDWKMRLLSFAARPDGGVSIALNARMAAALAGHHVKINLDERRQLGTTDTEHICHGWLSAWIRAGQSKQIGIDKLAEKIWGAESAKEATIRKRRERTIKALEQIGSLDGWKIKIEGRGKTAKAAISRPALIE